MSEKKILIVEDDALVRESLQEILVQKGYLLTVAGSAEEALELLPENDFDVALVDLRLPQMTGMDFIRKAKEVYPLVDYIMMTSFATIETAVEAMKNGATEYITKPINDDELHILLSKIFKIKDLQQENQVLKNALTSKHKRFHNLIGEDPKMQRVYSIIEAISDTATTVLLKGESGTGKGMVAQAIHYSDPARRDNPYVEISCGAIPSELLESELFGHVKGAFTNAIRDRIGRFELANGGTVLLDEIDALPPYLQVKLLRVLQQKVFEMVGCTKTKKVDVRIIASTNVDLEAEIKKGNFREDLFYRLNVIAIDIPPLRERKGDIHNLVLHFLHIFAEKTKRKVKGISKDAMKVLVDYNWPGNVRELENTIERIVVLAQGEVIDAADLPDNVKRKVEPVGIVGGGEFKSGALKDILKEPERQIILKALEETGWNRKRAASILNINRTTLYNKMKEHQLL